MSQTRFGAGGELETVTWEFQVDTSSFVDNVNRAALVATGLLGITAKLGLPPNLERGLLTIQRVTLAAIAARAALLALQTATPWGVFAASLGLLGAATAFTDTVNYASQTR